MFYKQENLFKWLHSILSIVSTSVSMNNMKDISSLCKNLESASIKLSMQAQSSLVPPGL